MVYYYLDNFGVIFLPCRLLWHLIISVTSNLKCTLMVIG